MSCSSLTVWDLSALECEDDFNYIDTYFFPTTFPAEVFIGYRARLTFFGDIFLGRGVDRWSQKSALKEKFPFEHMGEFNKQPKENWIANLECPVTKEQASYSLMISLLKFSCRPEYIAEAKEYFDIFSLANNHTDNMEEVHGFQQTKQYLSDHQLQYFGHYDNARLQDLCEVVQVAVDPLDANGNIYHPVNEATKFVTHIPIALCGYHNVFQLPTDEEIDVILDYSRYFITIIMPHQGEEYKVRENRWQQSVFRSMIDHGADMVIGGHTHSVQRTEVNQDRLIVYSLGNFIFDQLFSRDVRRGLIVSTDLFFSLEQPALDDLSLLPNCSGFKDGCLDMMSLLDLPKLEYHASFFAQVSENKRRQVHKANSVVTKSILRQANWDKTIKLLSNQ
jgi:hypothetical protein